MTNPWDGHETQQKALYNLDQTIAPAAGAITVREKPMVKLSNGDYFMASEEFSTISSSGGTHDIRFETPTDQVIRLRLYEFAVTAAPGEVKLYEDTVVSGAGSPFSPYCLDRPTGDSGIDVNLETDPTISDVGTLLETKKITGARKEGGHTQRSSMGWRFKSDTDYLIRYENVSTSDADGSFVVYWGIPG